MANACCTPWPAKRSKYHDRPAELVVAVVDVPLERLEGRMDRERHVEVLGGGEDRVVRGGAVGHARDGERADERAAAPVGDRALELGRRRGRIAEGEVRDGNEAPARVATEVGDPAVVGAAVRGRQRGIEQLGFPQETESRIEDRLGEPLPIEELDALLHVHGAERRAPQVRLLRPWANSPHILGTHVASHRGLAEIPGLVHLLAHAAEGAELANARELRALAIDLEVLVAVVAHADPDRAVSDFRLEVLLPQIGRLQDVSVAVDHGVVCVHRVHLYWRGTSRTVPGMPVDPVLRPALFSIRLPGPWP